jgi:FdhE protein
VTDFWQRRIDRADELAHKFPFAAEMLRFYAAVAGFQRQLSHRLESTSSLPVGSPAQQFAGPPELPQLLQNFTPFLLLVEKVGPAQLAETARDLQARDRTAWMDLLNAFWDGTPEPATGLEMFFAQAFLQPYAEFVRNRAGLEWEGYSGSLCPFCHRKPVLGVLRQQGDGGRRTLVCSFCLAEWEFRRIVCPSCGEENEHKLAVYSATDFDYIRVDCCDTCKQYLKSIDLTTNGLAEPLVDEIASAPLDLWAREHGYAKLQLNVVGL